MPWLYKSRGAGWRAKCQVLMDARFYQVKNNEISNLEQNKSGKPSGMPMNPHTGSTFGFTE